MTKAIIASFIILSLGLTGCSRGGGGGGSSAPKPPVADTKPEPKPEIVKKDCRASDGSKSDLFLFNLKEIHRENSFNSSEIKTAGDYCIDSSAKKALVVYVKANDNVTIDLDDYTTRFYSVSGARSVGALFAYIFKQYGVDFNKESSGAEEILLKARKNLTVHGCEKNPESVGCEDLLKGFKAAKKIVKGFSDFKENLYLRSEKYMPCLKSELYLMDEHGHGTPIGSENAGKDLYDINITPSAAGRFSLKFKLKTDFHNNGCELGNKDSFERTVLLKGKELHDVVISNGDKIDVMDLLDKDFKTELREFDDFSKTLIVN